MPPFLLYVFLVSACLHSLCRPIISVCLPPFHFVSLSCRLFDLYGIAQIRAPPPPPPTTIWPLCLCRARKHCLCFGAVTSTGPVCLSDLLKIYTSFRQLRSSADNRILCISSVTTKSYGERSFSHTAPTLWNTLPKDVRFSQSAYSFRSALKTHIFPT